MTSALGEATPERGGRRKKFYRLAPLGMRMLRESVAALQRMTKGLGERLELP